MTEANSARRAFWKPSEVLAWICTRDFGAVEFVFAGKEDSLLQAIIAVEEWERRTGGDALMGPAAACAQLQNLCREGRLTASGILYRWGETGQPSDRRQIPVEAWCEPGSALQQRRGELELWFSARSEGDHWTALLYKRTAVLDCWSASKSALNSSVELKAGEWLAAEVGKGPPTKAKEFYKADLKALYRIGERAFDRAWKKATSVPGADAWRKSGPKGKKPGNSKQ